jgi:hypothetical protein
MKPEGRLASQHVAELWLADAYVAPGDPQARPRKVLAAYLPEKDEDFRELVYGFGFRWCVRRWQRELTPRMGDPMERLAELAHALIGEGFMVRVAERAAADIALSGEFEDERTRWVDVVSNGGERKFLLTWARRDDLYNTVKNLPGARWDGHGTQLPLGSAEEVADFADANGFHLSEAARAAVDGHRAAILASVTVKPRKPKPTGAGIRRDMASRPEGIDASLRDDD